MKRSKGLSIIALLLSVLLLAACSGNNTGQTGTSSAAQNTTASGGSEETKEILTLTAYRDLPAQPSNWSWGDDPTSRWITEKTGIRIDVTSAADSTGTQLTTMLASGQKLPDFIISNAKSVSRRLLISQGFVQPLNKLADEYYPEFWDVLPSEMDVIYKEADGNFYFVTNWYGDPKRANAGEVNNFTPVSFNINTAIYKEMGSPDISTWEKFTEHLKEVKKAYPDIDFILYDQHSQMAEYNRGLANLVARLFGAQNDYYQVNGDDTLTLLPRTQIYRNMLEQLNQLYRAGIINAEMYTHAPNSDQQKSVMTSRNFYAFCGYYWSMINMMGLPKEEEYFTIDFPLPEGADKSKFHVYNDFLSIGTTATYITTDTQYPKECIQYLAFLLSDEGQYAQRYGTLGYTFEFDENGAPKYTPLKDEAEAKGFDVLQRLYGVHNYNFSWVTQNWVAMAGAKYTYPYPGIMNHFKLVAPYMKNERLADMTFSITDEDGMILKEQILNLWRSMVPQIVTADNDYAFEAAYKKFMDDLEIIGVKKFEEILSENRLSWIAKGLERD